MTTVAEQGIMANNSVYEELDVSSVVNAAGTKISMWLTNEEANYVVQRIRANLPADGETGG